MKPPTGFCSYRVHATRACELRETASLPAVTKRCNHVLNNPDVEWVNVMIVLFGFSALITGSLLIGYSFGFRAGVRKDVAKNVRIFDSKSVAGVDRSVNIVADGGNVPFVEATTDRERAIAEAVDEKFLGDAGNRQPTIRDYLDISASIDFVMSASDSQFLVDYLRWRASRDAVAKRFARILRHARRSRERQQSS